MCHKYTMLKNKIKLKYKHSIDYPVTTEDTIIVLINQNTKT